MRVDLYNEFARAAAVTASGAIGDSINFGETEPDRGLGTPLRVRVVVDEDFATGTSLTIKVQDSADNASFADIQATEAILTATLVKGYVREFYLPPKFRQYVRIYGTVGGSNFTTGELTIEIVPI